jgi:hypothetical protein
LEVQKIYFFPRTILLSLGRTAHPSQCVVGSFPGVNGSGRNVHIVPKLRTRGANTLLPLYTFRAWTFHFLAWNGRISSSIRFRNVCTGAVVTKFNYVDGLRKTVNINSISFLGRYLKRPLLEYKPPHYRCI